MINYNTTKTDDSKSSTFKSKSTNKRIMKKVGHKGDYAIVKVGNPFITSVKTGSGTTGDPYVYTIDLSSDLTSDLDSKIISVRAFETGVNLQKSLSILPTLSLDDYTINASTISFSTLIKTNVNSSIITSTEIANNTSINYNILSSHVNQGSINNNNRFHIDISKTSVIPKSIKALVDLEGYDVDVTNKSTNNIQFKITYNNIDVTNKHLVDEADLTISFVIEW